MRWTFCTSLALVLGILFGSIHTQLRAQPAWGKGSADNGTKVPKPKKPAPVPSGEADDDDPGSDAPAPKPKKNAPKPERVPLPSGEPDDNDPESGGPAPKPKKDDQARQLLELMDQARSFQVQGQWKKMADALNGVIRITDQYAVAWVELAYAYDMLQQYDSAIRAADSALKLDKTNVRALAHKGYAQIQQKKYALAVQTLTQAHNLDRTDTGVCSLFKYVYHILATEVPDLPESKIQEYQRCEQAWDEYLRSLLLRQFPLS